MTTQALDEAKVGAFVGRVVDELGATLNAGLVVIGDELGLYPALDGVEEKLRAGATVADVGCGHGASTLLMAEAYPASTFVGFDYHAGSIEEARRRARATGLAEERVRFEVSPASGYAGTGYDL